MLSKRGLRLIVVALLVTLVNPLCATDYYVSKNGSDLNSGLSPDQAFKTIQRASNEMDKGDTCYIDDGWYCETIRPPIQTNGTGGEGNQTITYTAYENAYPRIVAGRKLDVVWTLHSGHIWKTTIPNSFYDGTGIADQGRFVQLFIGDQAMVEARWPNIALGSQLVHMPRATADQGTNQFTLVDNDLPSGDYHGAMVHIVPGAEWISWTTTISRYQGGQSFDFDFTDWPHNNNLNQPSYDPEAGDRYYLFGCLAALDSPGEWYLDQDTDTAYLWCPNNSDPNSRDIFVKTEKYSVSLYDRESIVISRLRLLGGGINMHKASYCVGEDLQMRYVNHSRECSGYFTDVQTGNYMGGGHNVLRRCRIEHAGRSGVFDTGQSNTITQCIISDVNYDAAHTGAIRTKGEGGNYAWNSLFNSGRHIIFFMGASAFDNQPFEIAHNNCGHAGFLSSDCGVIYTWGTDHENGRIHHNYVHHNHAAHFPSGIYFDALGTTNPSENCLVHHNFVADIGYTAYYLVSTAKNIRLLHNTDDGSAEYSINHFEQPGFHPDWEGHQILNNIFNSTQRIVATSRLGSFDPGSYAGNVQSPLDSQGMPIDGSDAIDAGFLIAGINDDFNGDAPDCGCFEVGSPPWASGAEQLPKWLPPPISNATAGGGSN